MSEIRSVPRFLCGFSPHTLSLSLSVPSIFHFSKPAAFPSSLHIIISSSTQEPPPNPPPYLSPSLFEEASYKVDRLREGVGASKKLQARMSFTKLGPSVSYSAFHLLPIKGEITCTIFIALSKPFEVFLLHSLAQCRRLTKCSPKQYFIYLHIKYMAIHIYDELPIYDGYFVIPDESEILLLLFSSYHLQCCSVWSLLTVFLN